MVSGRTYYQNKRLKALRKLDQRTKNYEDLREYKKISSNNKKGKLTIVERIMQLDCRHKSM